MLTSFLLLAASLAGSVACLDTIGTFVSPAANSTLSFAGQKIPLVYYGVGGNGAVSSLAQVTITSSAFGARGAGLNASRVTGYSITQPLNLATLLPNAFQPGTSEDDKKAFRYNAYIYDLGFPAQALDHDVDGFLTVLEAYTVPSSANGLTWTNRATLDLKLLKP